MLDRVVVGDQPPVGVGVAAREPLELLAAALEIEPHRQLAAVGEGNVRERVGLDVGEPVALAQPELVLAQQRVGLDQRMAGRARVDQIAGLEHLFRGRAAAGNRARVEHDHLVAGAGEIGRGDQAVVARPATTKSALADITARSDLDHQLRMRAAWRSQASATDASGTVSRSTSSDPASASSSTCS